MQAPQTVARIALEMPLQPTTGETLKALSAAERAGYQRGRIEALIEAQNVAALDALQIRGGWQFNLAREGEGSFVGYDYCAQRWIEHVWQIST